MHNTHNHIQEILQECRNQLPKFDSGWPHVVQRAAPYIYEHLFEENLTVTATKKECRINGKSFACRFRKCTGFYPKEFILHYRIMASKRLLKIEGLPISQIGLQVGFSSHSAFCKTFKNKVGVKPSVWRKQTGIGDADKE